MPITNKPYIKTANAFTLAVFRKSLDLIQTFQLKNKLKEDSFISSHATAHHVKQTTFGTEIFGTRVVAWMKNRNDLPQ
jgi:hypothetical protein